MGQRLSPFIPASFPHLAFQLVLPGKVPELGKAPLAAPPEPVPQELFESINLLIVSLVAVNTDSVSVLSYKFTEY